MKSVAADDEAIVEDVGDLRAFAITCDTGSLTAAAQIMGESKATVSRRITRLETALGTTLVRRSPHTLEMTADGASYRARVREVLELLGVASAATRGERATPSGRLRVSAPPSFREPLARALARFAVDYPDIMVSVHVSSRFVDMEAEHFDVALRVTTKLADSSLVAHRIGTRKEERVAVAAPSYLKEHRAPTRIADLADHRLIGHTEAGTMGAYLFRLKSSGARIKISLPIALACTDIDLVRDLSAQGAGVSILSRRLVRRSLDDGSLVHLLPDVVAPGLNLYVLHRGGRFVPSKVRLFVEVVKRSLAGAT